MLMPLLDSQAPVFLFNDDWRAGKAILRARDFNKDTGVDGMGIILPYVFICLVLSNNLLCPLLRIRAFMHLFLFQKNEAKMHILFNKKRSRSSAWSLSVALQLHHYSVFCALWLCDATSNGL